jgi:spermidine synthase
VAGGGALGGLFVGILAPVLFDGYYELELGLVLAWLLVPVSCSYDPASGSTAVAARWRSGVASALAVALIAYVSAPTESSSKGLQYRGRTFFGVLRVRDRGTERHPQRHLGSGSTLHGIQFLVPGGGRWPSSYYGRATAIGLLMAERAPEVPSRIGVIGLGAGTLAAYGREGDLLRFYEIDPAVVRIARDDGYFDFLAASPAEIEIVVGDARLSLAREQSLGIVQDFDILVLDAFSSDAIPVHLLTREAFLHYADALAPDGFLAVHVTNWYLELMSQVARQGLESGLEALQVQASSIPRYQSAGADWVLLHRDPNRLRELAAFMSQYLEGLGVPPSRVGMNRPTRSSLRHIPAWTDDYSDVFSLMRSPRSSSQARRSRGSAGEEPGEN